MSVVAATEAGIESGRANGFQARPTNSCNTNRATWVPASIVDDVRRLYSGGEFQEAAAAASLMPDDFVRRVALAGNRRQAVERIEQVLGAGADSMHVFPLGDRRMETVRAFAECWRELVNESGAHAPAAVGRA